MGENYCVKLVKNKDHHHKQQQDLLFVEEGDQEMKKMVNGLNLDLKDNIEEKHHLITKEKLNCNILK
jgi:hypothetical protein